MGSLHLVRLKKKEKSGKISFYWILRETVYYKEIGAAKPQYVAYIGVKPSISESKAQKISKEKGVALEDLKNVNGLEIVPD